MCGTSNRDIGQNDIEITHTGFLMMTRCTLVTSHQEHDCPVCQWHEKKK